MDNLIYMIFISIFVPILLMALLVDKKARLPVVFVLIGIFISVFASEINGLFHNLLDYSVYELTVIVTPISEEILKALPILFYAVVISDKKEDLFTASMAVGIGFAILENAYVLIEHSESFTVLDGIIRAFGSGLMHGMCTLLVGVGICFVKKRRKVFLVGTFALLSTAITYHAIYNMLIQSEYMLVGALLPLATYLPLLVWRILVKLRNQKEELV